MIGYCDLFREFGVIRGQSPNRVISSPNKIKARLIAAILGVQPLSGEFEFIDLIRSENALRGITAIRALVMHRDVAGILLTHHELHEVRIVNDL